MTIPTPPGAPRAPGYELACLTGDDAQAMLQRVFGAERAAALWTDACRTARVSPLRVDTPDALERVAGALTSQGGAAATVARSIEIRLRTHARLSARRDTTPGARS